MTLNILIRTHKPAPWDDDWLSYLFTMQHSIPHQSATFSLATNSERDRRFRRLENFKYFILSLKAWLRLGGKHSTLVVAGPRGQYSALRISDLFCSSVFNAFELLQLCFVNLTVELWLDK